MPRPLFLAHLILAFAFGYTTVGALDSLARQLGVAAAVNLAEVVAA